MRGVALNDRAYIYGLRKAGYTKEEIAKIRAYDIRAQLQDAYVTAAQRNEEIYRARQEQNGIIIFNTTEGDTTTLAVDRVVLEHPDTIPSILDLRRDAEGRIVSLYFTGPSVRVKKAAGAYPPSYDGNATEGKVSDFIGWIEPTKEAVAQVAEALGVAVAWKREKH